MLVLNSLPRYSKKGADSNSTAYYSTIWIQKSAGVDVKLSSCCIEIMEY